MEQALNTIYELLLEQADVQKKLLDLSQEKRKVIIANDTGRLSEIVQIELKHLSAVKSIEKKREAAVSVVADMMNVPKEEITLSYLAGLVSGEAQQRYLRIQKELSDVLKSQLEANDLNQKLLETQLDYTNLMLTIMSDTDDTLNNFYGGDGKAANPDMGGSTGFFDHQI